MTKIIDVDNGVQVTFSDLDGKEAAKKMEKFFVSEGYKLEEGTIEKGAYGTGSTVMRILLGAFAKRFKFWVEVNNSGKNSIVKITKDGAAKISGGAIGYKKQENEFKRLKELLDKI